MLSVLSKVLTLSYIATIAHCLNRADASPVDVNTDNQTFAKTYQNSLSVQVQLNEISKKLLGKCEKAEIDLDTCSSKLIGLGNSDMTFPESMQELNSVYCPKFYETVSCIKNSTSCYKPFERQVLK